MDFRRIIAQLLLAFSFLAIPLKSLAAPIANDDTRSVPQGVTITINVLNNDFDDEGYSLSVVGDAIIQPESGEVLVNNDGGITYIPDPDYVGQDQFSYTIINNAPEPESATALVIVNVVPPNIRQNASNPNESSVAQALDAICDELNRQQSYDSVGQAQLAERCLALMSLDDDEVAAQVIQQVTPEETLSLTRVSNNASEVQGQMVSNRLMQLGSGIDTAAQGGLTWSVGHKGGAAGDDSLFAKLGVYASLQLEDAEKDRTLYESGFDYTANGIALGADYALSPDLYVGGAFGLTMNDLKYSNNGGKVESEIYTFIVYSTLSHNNFSFDVQLGTGNSNIDISRYMAYSIPGDTEFSAQTDGETSGDQVFLTLQTQYMWSREALTLFPLASLTYSDSKVKGYADNDASGWEVVLGDQKIKRLLFEAALQATYAINTSWGVVVPNGDITFLSNLNDDTDTVSGYFAYAPEDSLTFGMGGEEPDSFYYQLGLGSSFIFPGGNTAFIGVRQTLGYDDYSSTQLQASIRMEF